MKPAENKTLVELYDTRYALQNIWQLVLLLKKQNMLPAIIFSYDRTLIRSMMNKLVEQMKKIDVEVSLNNRIKFNFLK